MNPFAPAAAYRRVRAWKCADILRVARVEGAPLKPFSDSGAKFALRVIIRNKDFHAIWRNVLGNDLAETVFEQVRTLVAGDNDRPERAGLGAGWQEREGWVGLIVAHVVGLANFLALCHGDVRSGKVTAIAKCLQQSSVKPCA